MITIYTPTFNRAYCLQQLYESLTRQTNNSFLWLVVDDGSTDNTQLLIKNWIDEANFDIVYLRQENEGKMAKLNFIHSIINTELCTCIDSDDYLTDNAIELIFQEWRKVKNDKSIAGIVGLDIYKNGSLVGSSFPDDIKKIKFKDFKKNNIFGDKKFVYRSKLLKEYPDYPSYKNERFPAPGYLYRLIDVDYDLWLLNKPLCIVEYMEDGLSKNKFSQFKNSPNLFMFYRQERMRLSGSYAEKYKNAIHYVSSCMFAKKSLFKNNKYPISTLLAIPIGFFLNIYIRFSNKKGVV